MTVTRREPRTLMSIDRHSKLKARLRVLHTSRSREIVCLNILLKLAELLDNFLSVNLSICSFSDKMYKI